MILHRLGCWTWWSQIDEKLYLGSIPLTTFKHAELIPFETGSSAILSVIQPFEMENSTLFTKPVPASTWKKNKFFHEQVSMLDLKIAPPEQIALAIAFIEEQIAKGSTVYVHCKAGVGRSASVVAAYLIKSGKIASVDKAIEFLLEKRPQIALGINCLTIRKNTENYLTWAQADKVLN